MFELRRTGPSEAKHDKYLAKEGRLQKLEADVFLRSSPSPRLRRNLAEARQWRAKADSNAKAFERSRIIYKVARAFPRGSISFPRMIPDNRLGLIAGNGKFPLAFAKEARSRNISIIAAGVVGDTSPVLRFFVDKFRTFKVGELKKMFSFLKSEGVNKVIMAGQVNPNNLFDPKVQLDGEFQSIFNALNDRKADTIFKAVADRLKQEGLELIDSTFLLEDYLAPKGTLTRRAPTLRELEDIEFGRQIAKTMGDIDVGQTVVVKERAIIAIEAMEGTDKTIIRGGKIAREGAVVAKMSKPKQDLRFDIPVIGPRTIRAMIKSKAKCLAIEAEKTLIIDRFMTVKLADKAGICIVAT